MAHAHTEGAHRAHESYESDGGHAHHGTHRSGHADMFRRLFRWNLILALPVIATSAMVER